MKTGKLDYHVSATGRQSFAEGALVYSDAIKEIKNFKFAPLPEPAKAVYCITGTLSMSRDDMVDFLEQYNFLFTPQITRTTNYLIVGESPGKTKLDKAVKYNVPTINEAQLMNLLKEYSDEQ